MLIIDSGGINHEQLNSKSNSTLKSQSRRKRGLLRIRERSACKHFQLNSVTNKQIMNIFFINLQEILKRPKEREIEK